MTRPTQDRLKYQGLKYRRSRFGGNIWGIRKKKLRLRRQNKTSSQPLATLAPGPMLKHRAALFSQRMQTRRRRRQRAAADLKKHRRLLEEQQRWQVETFLLMAGVALSLPAPRRTVQRAEGGWRGSTLYGYLQHGDDILYK